MQQNVGLKNECIVLHVTDVFSLTHVTSTILLQTHVDWCTVVMTVGRLIIHTVNILATKCTVRYARKINPTLTNTSSHNHQRSRVMDKCIFVYDVEHHLDEEKKHDPNLYVVHKVYSKIEMHGTTHNGLRCTCDRQQMVFRGEDTLTDFGKWLFSSENKSAICLAHNAQAYYLYLILEYVHENGIKPDIIQNGKTILCLDSCGMKFIDSLNYFNTSLAKLPQMFGFNELHKGYFPPLVFHQRESALQGGNS